MIEETSIRSAIKMVEMTYGCNYIAPNTSLDGNTLAALINLAEVIGAHDPRNMRQVDLVALYAIARKSPMTAVDVASKRFANPAKVINPVTLEPEPEIDLIPAPEPEPMPEPEPDIARLADGTPTHKITARVLIYARARVNIYLYGPAGSGKTTMAKHVATELGLRCYATGSVDSAHNLLGYIAPGTGQYIRTAFREAFEHGGCFLLDEIDGSDPTAIVALNQAIANDWFTFPDGVIKKHTDFVLMAAANTVGNGADRVYVGRNQMDGASLDRFARIRMDYDEALELYTAPNKPWCRYVQAVRQAIVDNGIKAIVSPRATYDGAAVIAMGETWDGAAQAKIFEGIKTDDVERIKRTVRIGDYSNG